MRKIEFKVCRKCGKVYMWQSGGIIATPSDFSDHGLCPVCRVSVTGKVLKSVVDILKRKDRYG